MMKTHLIPTVLLLSLILAVGCSSHDSTDKADKINDQKIEKQAVAIGSDAKDKAKEVAERLVDLASMGMTEYELSKIAAERAVNPQVKAYARQRMNEHQQTEGELRRLAKQLNITLPTAMSNEGKDRVKDLADRKPGTAFDVKYLGEMAKVNDKAIDVTDDLEDDAPIKAVKEFARKLQDEDKKHRKQAEQLKNVLD